MAFLLRVLRVPAHAVGIIWHLFVFGVTEDRSNPFSLSKAGGCQRGVSVLFGLQHLQAAASSYGRDLGALPSLS